MNSFEFTLVVTEHATCHCKYTSQVKLINFGNQFLSKFTRKNWKTWSHEFLNITEAGYEKIDSRLFCTPLFSECYISQIIVLLEAQAASKIHQGP